MLQYIAAKQARCHVVYRYIAAARVLAQQTTYQRRLPGAIGPHERHAVAPFDAEVYSVEYGGTPKGLSDVLKPNQDSLPIFLMEKLSEFDGQASMQRPHRVQSAPTSILTSRALFFRVISST
jgi:hypothetical protein